MLNTIANLKRRKEFEEYVDTCRLETPEEVARLFREYTWLIWDYKLLGRIYDFYTDDAVMHVEDGKTVFGVDSVMRDTLAFTSAVPTMKAGSSISLQKETLRMDTISSSPPDAWEPVQAHQRRDPEQGAPSLKAVGTASVSVNAMYRK